MSSCVLCVNQSNYIPWKGYFDLIKAADKFIIYDDVQFTKNDWRNRNQIKTANGLAWLSIPIETAGRFGQKIKEAQVVADSSWSESHWAKITASYKDAPYFKKLSPLFKDLYLQAGQEKFLSKINFIFLKAFCELLEISTQISWSSDYDLSGERSERLVHLCQQVGADHYVSGPAAKDYLNQSLFTDKKIKVEFFDYSNYPVYPQLHSEFMHNVSALDLIFNCGPTAPNFLKQRKSLELASQ